MHIDRAASLILSKMHRQEFNEAVYYEFIRSDIVLRVKVTYDSLNRMVGLDIYSLWHIANRMTVRLHILGCHIFRFFCSIRSFLPVSKSAFSVSAWLLCFTCFQQGA
ncbi:unnamed protein product [Cylicocyclus nassatus]|uniref:Uncharacterized protein n=1 Tax=Cylicocyclus nassatus TaxID=53992 RepID=A0AA36H6N3_CYLNA|nr:unnamed protein product [Cylicocyclus nassatus]